MTGTPIAIVGEGCVLPGAASPAALWEAVAAGRDLLSPVPAGAWGLPERLAPRGRGVGLAGDEAPADPPYRGGFIDRGLALDAEGFAVDAETVRAADVSTRWLLEAGRQAVRAGGRGSLAGLRASVLLANLSYPTRAMVDLDFALRVAPMLGRACAPELPPRALGNAFSSGRPAFLLAAALGVEGPASALDAACASSLYALLLGCEALAEGRADAVLVGAVNGCESMFLHKGFEAIGALSPTGSSRPFHAEADGLVPSEGAAALLLRRLDDAERQNEPVRAVILGGGLSNDGRRRGLLAPDGEAQGLAIAAALAEAGVDACDIGLVECHATGTRTGDGVEIACLNRLFAGHPDLPVGSLKSNLGHSITVAGLAGAIKLSAALEAGIRPATLHAEVPHRAFAEGPLRPLHRAEPWPGTAAPLAGLSTFGFGGNNAHVVLAAPDYLRRSTRGAEVPPRPVDRAAEDASDPVVVCGVGVVLGHLRGLDALTDRAALAEAARAGWRTGEVCLSVNGLRFPPRDLAGCLAQQTLALEIAGMALDGLALPDRARRAVIVGMGCDPDAGRMGLLWRAMAALGEAGPPDPQTVGALDAAIGGLRGAAGTLGPMPNLPANRLNVQHDMAGLGYTVAAEELSGLAALEQAADLLRRGAVDLALAGAVDACDAALHARALDALAPGHAPLADGGCLIALMRRSEAERLDNPVLATLDVSPAERCGAGAPAALHDPPLVGGAPARPHAARAAVELALALAQALGGVAGDPDDRDAPVAHAGLPRRLEVASFAGWRQSARIDAPARAPAPGLLPDAPHLAVFGASDRAGLAEAVSARSAASGDPGAARAVRLAVAAPTAEALERRLAGAAGLLAEGRAPSGPGVFFGEGPAAGGVAFGFPGLGAADASAGRRLCLAFPEAVEALRRAQGTPADAEEGLERLLRAPPATRSRDQARQTRALSLLGYRVLRDGLGLAPDACFGVSLGEESMLVATGVWPIGTNAGCRAAFERFHAALGDTLEPVAAWLGLAEGTRPDWVNMDVFAPVAAVEAAVSGVEHAAVTLITADGHCVVSGPAAACRAVAAALPEARVARQPVTLAAHGAHAGALRGTLVGGLGALSPGPLPAARLYHGADASVATGEAAALAERYADAVLEPLDLRPLLRRVHADGARIFVDVGPGATLAPAIRSTLAGEDMTVVALAAPGRDPLLRLAEAAAQLHAAGVPVDIAGLANRFARLRGAPRREETAGPEVLRLPAHLPPIRPPSRTGPEGNPGTDRPSAGAPVAVRAAANGDGGRKAAPPPPRRLPLPPALAAPAFLSHLRRPAAPLDGPARQLPQAPRLAEAAAAAGSTPAVNVGNPREDAAARGGGEQGPAGAGAAETPARPRTRSRTGTPPGEMPSPKAELRAGTTGPAAANGAERPKHPDGAERTARRGPPKARPRRKPAPLPVRTPTGPVYDREALEVLACGSISSVFGPRFAEQDAYARQCRLPRPPLLLVDRVLGIEGEPCSMGRGVCWTETEVTEDAWYLEGGRMPFGIVIEAGQADLLLISWLGCDFLNRGERIYRLLGCEVTFHGGPLPGPGDTIRFQIHVDGHARIGDTRLFFFSYDSRVGDRLVSSVREGQAGFFSDAELAGSDGVLWEPEDHASHEQARVDPVPGASGKRAFTDAEIAAFAAGDAWTCFGEGFERAAAHTATPRIASGPMQLIDRVTAFDPAGGPLGRGYLCAEADAPTDAWFYDGHFHNDPCMPGTLMAEAAVQALMVTMAAMGLTVDRDGWRFRPVEDEPFRFLCRGQVVPDRPHRLTYEVFVEEIHAGPTPTVFAALLARSDGFKVFLCERIGLRLARDWPLAPRARSGGPPRIVSPSGDVPGDAEAMLACAIGPPGDAFGAMYAALEARGMNAPRLPGPPYLLVSRVLSVDCPPGVPTPGGRVRTAYDVPPDAWYFGDAGNGAMPFSVLTEVLLQPCGWLASYMGFALAREVRFRNLDGEGLVLEREVGPDAGTLEVEVEFLRHATAGPTTIVFYAVTCRAGGETVARVTTDFGFFPPAALAQQKGLPATAKMRTALEALPPPEGRAALGGDAPAVPYGRLEMLDTVTGFDPRGGEAGLGRAVGRQHIDPAAWYFRAHFYEDPVQPGSLGLEAVLSLLKAAARLRGLDDGIPDARFEAPACGEPVAWRYRGQVVPSNRTVTTEIEILAVEEERDAEGRPVRLVRGRGALWVDGLRIYSVDALALRIRPGGKAGRFPLGAVRLDVAAASWLGDHRPTHAAPVWPMMALAGLLLRGPEGAGPVPRGRIEGLEMHRWLRLDDGAVTLAVSGENEEAGARRRRVRRLDPVTGEAGETLAAALILPPGERPTAAWEPADGADRAEPADPYGGFGLFHDRAFRAASDLRAGPSQSSHAIDAASALARAGGEPAVLLDALLHGFPHGRPELGHAAGAGCLGVPYRIDRLELFEPLPAAGTLLVVTRFRGAQTPRTLRFGVQACLEGRVVLEADVVEALMPHPLARLAPADRRRFCRSRRPVEGFALGRAAGQGWQVARPAVAAFDVLPGTAAAVYGVPAAWAQGDRLAEAVALKEWLAAARGLHPAEVLIGAEAATASGMEPVPLAALHWGWRDGTVTVAFRGVRGSDTG